MTDPHRIELGLFKFPRLYLDYLAGKLPAELDVPKLLTLDGLDSKGKVEDGRSGFWGTVAEYDARLGAGEVTLKNLERLGSGSAVPVVTGQQPGLFGGPLYTLYKAVTASALARRLTECGREAVPVLWNASDDTDFLEVSSAGFFGRDLARKRLSIDEAHHSPRKMVGALSLDMVREAIQELLNDLTRAGGGAYTGLDYVRDLLEGTLSRARDWGEFFSALFLGLLRSEGLVLVDAREAAGTPEAGRVFSAYLNKAGVVEGAVLSVLGRIRELGYEEPVSTRSAEACVFEREGDERRKLSGDELHRVLGRLDRGEIALLPNVILGPVLRHELMNPVADVLGPSEMSYSVVSGAVHRHLGFEQRPVFPRLSLTVVPGALTRMMGEDGSRVAELILFFDRRLHDYLEQNLSADVVQELGTAEAEVRSGLERIRRLAESAGRGAGEVTASASRKMEFELKRMREEFVSASKKNALSDAPWLRNAGDFLLPNGNLQERGYCSLAPLALAGEPFLGRVKDIAALQVRESLEGRVYHYAFVADMLQRRTR